LAIEGLGEAGVQRTVAVQSSKVVIRPTTGSHGNASGHEYLAIIWVAAVLIQHYRAQLPVDGRVKGGVQNPGGAKASQRIAGLPIHRGKKSVDQVAISSVAVIVSVTDDGDLFHPGAGVEGRVQGAIGRPDGSQGDRRQRHKQKQDEEGSAKASRFFPWGPMVQTASGPLPVLMTIYHNTSSHDLFG